MVKLRSARASWRAGSGGGAEPKPWGALAGWTPRPRAAMDASTAVASTVRGARLGQATAASRALVTYLIDGTRCAPALAAVHRQAATAALRVAGEAGLADVTFVAVSGCAAVDVATHPVGGAHLELRATEAVVTRHGLAEPVDAALVSRARVVAAGGLTARGQAVAAGVGGCLDAALALGALGAGFAVALGGQKGAAALTGLSLRRA